MKKLMILLFLILSVSLCYATCSENQVDINTADKNELTKITYIGEIRAEELISLRPFESIEDLVRIKGIGDTYLQRITEQDLACIEDEEPKIEEKIEKPVEEEVEPIEEIVEQEPQKEIEEIQKPQTIKLAPKTIKTQEPEINPDKKGLKGFLSKYAMQGFVIFSIIIVLLFIIRKNKYKNEFN